MTYATLKAVTSGLLVGDNVLPKDTVALSGLVSYALLTVATKAESLHLITIDPLVPALKLGMCGTGVRYPVTPVDDTDIIDIDEELTVAVARFIASYVSKQKGGIHVDAANRVILDFNAKTYEFFQTMKDKAYLVGETDLCTSTLYTEWLAQQTA